MQEKILRMKNIFATDLLLRYSMGIVFFWFGILKPLGLSPAQEMATMLVEKVTGSAVLGKPLFLILSLMEIAIGVCFFFSRTTRIAVFLLFLQMPLTFIPLIALPNLTFKIFPLVPSLEGQYIIKNLVLVSVGLLILFQERKQPNL